ncbi:MAG: UPF0147 family protein [Candidatus Marsarchaeota archaeon]|nr:UPF0147 family protein [Candidatus Marsarchaeota archaeon]
MSEQRIKEIIALMDLMIDDSSVPKNIRKVVDEARVHLRSEEELPTKISSAVQSLVGVSEDINMPMHARTQVWTILSALESIKTD